MKHTSTLFLKIIILLLATAVFVGLIWFPQTEGRAANLDLISIYKDPFIIYMYVASIPFFIAIYQVFKLLSYVDKNKIFSRAAIKTVRNIKYCALATIGFLVVTILYIRLLANGDDPAGPTMLGFIAIIISAVIAASADVFQKLLQNRTHSKSKK